MPFLLYARVEDPTKQVVDDCFPPDGASDKVASYFLIFPQPSVEMSFHLVVHSITTIEYHA